MIRPESSSPDPVSGWQRLLPWVALVALVTLAYAGSLSNDFVFYDDDLYVTSNSHVQQGLTPASIAYACTTLECSNWIPVTWLSLEMDVTLFGLQPWGFHLTNLILHVLNVLLLFAWLRGAAGATGPAWATAAIWGVHPLHVESVAWISERKNLLCLVFFLLMLLVWNSYVRRPVWQKYLGALGLFALGLMSKSMIVTAPVLLLLLDFWPLRRCAAPATAPDPSSGPVPQFKWAWLVLEKVPFLLLAIGISAVTVLAQRGASTMTSLEVLPLHIRLGNAIHGYGWYLLKTLAPTNLMVIYPHPFEKLDWNEVGLASAVLFPLTALAWLARRRCPWLLTGWLWFGISLGPVIGLIQVGIQAHADRYAYLPQIGLLIAVVWSISRLLSGYLRGRELGGLLTGLALAGGLAFTMIQAQTWVNTQSLWTYTLSVDPDNWVAHYERGRMFIAQEDWNLAEPDLRRSWELWPHQEDTLLLLAAVEERQGRPQAASQLLEQVLRMNPQHEFAQGHLERLRRENP